MLPDFVCVGTYKAATTWLFQVLDEHPGVFVPDVKEVHFFNRRGGMDAFVDKGPAWYSSLYAPSAPGAVLGDITPGYLACPDSAGRIAGLMPNARILLLLRDPIARLHSHYWYRAGMSAQVPSLDAVIDDWSEHLDDLVWQGMYATHLARFREHFPAEQIKVCFMEDLKADPPGSYASICEFIGVDSGFVPPSLTRSANTARAFRSKRLYRLNRLVARTLYLNGGDRVRRVIKRSGLPRLLDRFNRQAVKNPALSGSQRARLRSIYGPEIQRLEGMLDRDLSGWKHEVVA